MIEPGLAQQLERLPPLAKERAGSRLCKICGNKAPLFDVVDFNKHCSGDPYCLGVSGINVNYYRCHRCRFIFTDFIDDWTPAEIGRFIYNDDYIKVDPDYVSKRPSSSAVAFSSWLKGCEQTRILDYGSGSGMFADEMRLRGFEGIESYDPFSHPERPRGTFDLITCFEVIEHSPKPLETLADMANLLSPSGAIVIGQTIQPADIEAIRGRWWYIAPRNGHVSTFGDETFLIMAEKVGLKYRRGEGSLFGFTRPKIAGPLEAFMALIGPTVSIKRLLSPGEAPAEVEGWHRLEKYHEAPFRWSKVAGLAWQNCWMDEGTTIIKIPYIMEIRAGFASESSIVVGETVLPTHVKDGSICAVHVSQHGGAHDVLLRTPEPLSPKQLNESPDDRPLGLAIRAV
jgi:2-polyprenyl-6-hydroxyphenyl methylase/3-demethylubiquinone-9 3-methyltransferase